MTSFSAPHSGLVCFSVVTLWYALHGHAPDDVAGYRTRARWYTTKTEPSYDDMAVKLRRVIIADHTPASAGMMAGWAS